jgi:hypothetical protein
MKYTTAQDVMLDIEFAPQNYKYNDIYAPAGEKVRVVLAPYESIQIRHIRFSVSPTVKTDRHIPSSFGSETCGGEMRPIQ